MTESEPIKSKTKLFNKLRTIGKLRPIEKALVHLSQNSEIGNIFARIAPNNYQYPQPTMRRCERGGIRYDLDISDYMQYCIYFGIEIEPREKLYNLVKNGSTIIDVGTNIGETLLNFARINTKGRNIGFEPVPHLYEKAKTNIGLNKYKNIELINQGLSSDAETLSFQQPGKNNSGGIFLTKDGKDAAHSVQVVRLDDFAKQNGLENVSLIKIDVEGFEMNVLKGALEVLHNFKPTLFVEIDDSFLVRQNSSSAAVFDLLVSQGYKLTNANTDTPVEFASMISEKHLDIVAEPIL